MTDGLDVPAGAPAVLVRTLPVGDVRLADGRRLRRAPRAPLSGPGFLATGAWLGPGELSVLASLDDTPHGRLLHVSLAYPDHDPDWATIKAVRAGFFPETVDVAMVLPRSDDYVNLHQHAFHLWQTPTTWG